VRIEFVGVRLEYGVSGRGGSSVPFYDLIAGYLSDLYAFGSRLLLLLQGKVAYSSVMESNCTRPR
jgi:hypothetical protein